MMTGTSRPRAVGRAHAGHERPGEARDEETCYLDHRPGGLVHAIDSDWGMLLVEPLGPEPIAELFEAARIAYRTPLIGRRLYGLLGAAGFRDVRVEIRAAADTQGLFSPVVLNMAQYVRASGRMDVARIDELVVGLQRAMEDGTYLMVLPQFLVTGTA